jgi:predicted alpha-1,6-mannanase (GH76 family)
MTQGEEERARAIVRHHANRNSNRLTFPLSFDDLIAEIAAALRQRADEATREEREACAKIADSFTCGLCGMDGKSAAAIRARIKP